MIETSGYAAVPLGGDDYIELLPVSWNAIGKEGVKLRRRTYDDKALVRFRGQRSGVTAKKNLWEVRYDPYDITRIWVRNHWDGGWIQVPWKTPAHRARAVRRAGLQHARRILAERGQDARTRATAVTVLPRPQPAPAEAGTDGDDEPDPDENLAPVIRLPVFDAREEAKRWW